MPEQSVVASLDFLKSGAATFPQPIAISLGRLARSQGAADALEAAIKAGEVLTRYIAAVCVASFAARSEAATDGLTLQPLQGNLSFGHFLEICQRIAKHSGEHPCTTLLSNFRPKGKGNQRTDGPVDVALVALLNLRNELGHNLAGLQPARAKAILERDKPVERLVQALKNLDGLLSCPLFVIDQQRIERKRVWAVRLWLMGESNDPEPEEIEVESPGFEETHTPYLAIGDRILRLDPAIVWNIVPERERYGLLFVDSVEQKMLVYQTLDPVEIERNGESVALLAKLLSGEPRIPEQVLLPQGRKITMVWREMKSRIEESLRQISGAVPWEDYDAETVAWFAARLAPEEKHSARSTISDRLFDGRKSLGSDELRQAQILFGSERAVRRTLGRAMLDLRVVENDEERWKERIECHGNVLSSLRMAVDFVARQLGLGENSFDKLNTKTGTADYLAMREALINLFIHQDYEDASAAAQVELRAERATFFNAGYSLIGAERIVDGGRSQSRNPLIARALRLIGFAELAGSGITALLRAWRGEGRRPPIFESDRDGNTFTVRLDWRLVENTYDKLWKDRIGVRLTTEQASALNLALTPAGITAASVASGTGMTLDDAHETLKFLARQVLLVERDGSFFLTDHLREIVG
jgi:predicted HTH transcriptional regulator